MPALQDATRSLLAQRCTAAQRSLSETQLEQCIEVDNFKVYGCKAYL